MLDARAIFRLLIEEDPPAPMPDDPRQMGLDFNPDEVVDPKAEVMRYAETFRIPGGGPTTTYDYLRGKLRAGGRIRNRQRLGGRNTSIIDYGDRVAIRYHETDVVTAYPDGKVVVETGGWHPGGGQYSPWHGKPASGVTTRDRIAMMAGTAGGWDIYQKDRVWYWYNRSTGAGNWNDDRRFPFESGDTIYPDGSLELQAEPVEVRRRKKRA